MLHPVSVNHGSKIVSGLRGNKKTSVTFNKNPIAAKKHLRLIIFMISA